MSRRLKISIFRHNPRDPRSVPRTVEYELDEQPQMCRHAEAIDMKAALELANDHGVVQYGVPRAYDWGAGSSSMFDARLQQGGVDTSAPVRIGNAAVCHVVGAVRLEPAVGPSDELVACKRCEPHDWRGRLAR